MNSLKRLPVFFLLIFSGLGAYSQQSIEDSTIRFWFLGIDYGASLPFGDMGDRFGFTNQIGGNFGIKFRNNFYVYGGARFLFGNSVRERIAGNVTFAETDGNGKESYYAVGADGRIYNVLFLERGFYVPVMAGKILPFPKMQNPNCGIYIEAGAHFLEHKVRLQMLGNNIPSLSPEMLKGYDRLTNGLGLTQGLGLRYFSNNSLINFHAGIEVSESFTKNRRDYNYDTGMRDDSQRLDVMFTFKAGWTFLLYKEAPEDFYIY